MKFDPLLDVEPSESTLCSPAELAGCGRRDTSRIGSSDARTTSLSSSLVASVRPFRLTLVGLNPWVRPTQRFHVDLSPTMLGSRLAQP